MILGTCHFPSRAHAIAYYRGYHYSDTARVVDRKIAEHEIVIGAPNLKPGERLILIDQRCRYGIAYD